MNKFLAKNNGETLIQHSKNVELTVINIAKRVLSENILEKYSLVLSHASLLHDIGKLTDNFQKRFEDEESSLKKIKYAHNEISWAFLSKYYYNENDENKDLIL